MEVDVVNNLAALGPRIAREAASKLAIASALRQKARHANTMPHDGLVAGLELRDRLDVSLRNDQQVHRRLRIEVLEGEDLVVLVLDIGGGFADGGAGGRGT